MITPREAFELILRYVRPLEKQCRPLSEALGYCLAEDVRADRDLPPADRSAMDGYAVRSSDLAKCPCSLRLAGEVAAGGPARRAVKAGTCVRVLTGANIPPRADTVVMVEQTEEKDGAVTFRSAAKVGANILRQGEDAKKGALLFSKGTLLGALQIGVCAAVGKAEVKVHPRPRVALLCTGQELRDASARVRSHELRDYNGPALRAALRLWGYENVTHTTVPDDVKLLTSKLRRLAARHDVILVTGGVSVGKYDFVPAAIERIRATCRFHGVRMKPGKPSLYATMPGNRHLFGLPGNPLSAVTAFHEFALPALRRMSGVVEEECRPSFRVPLTSGVPSKGGRVRYVLARLSWGQNGPVAMPMRSHSSADFVAAGQADGVVVVPADVREMAVGSTVEFHPWRPLP